jgi:hypothetical protein
MLWSFSSSLPVVPLLGLKKFLGHTSIIGFSKASFDFFVNGKIDGIEPRMFSLAGSCATKPITASFS